MFNINDHQMGYQFETDTAMGEDTEYEIISPDYRMLMEEIKQVERKFTTYSKKRDGIRTRFQSLKRVVNFEAYM
jgi:hypothetical protein